MPPPRKPRTNQAFPLFGQLPVDTQPSQHDDASTAGGLRTDTLVDSVFILLGLTAVQRVIGFVRAVLFCRWLEPEELGRWDMAFGFLVLAAPLAVLAVPGTFGRYLERFRQQGQLRAFLRRTTAACAATALPAVLLIYFGRRWFSQLIYGTPDRTDLVVLLAVSLCAVVAYNFTIELFTALRNVRLTAGLQMANSLLFAAVGIFLLLNRQCSASSVIVAYAAACLLTTTGALWWARCAWRTLPPAGNRLGHGQLWSKLAPFAGWILLINLLTNLFEIADRYMIVHFYPGTAAETIAQVGNYHSSRIVPLLLVSIAAMLGTMITPHLSYRWEAGQRGEVCTQLRLFLKLLATGLTAAGVAVMFAAPLLFGVAFKGKFSDGLLVLPWTLTYCIWFGISMVAQTYLWCAERARLASVALLIGLGVNVGLNLLLLPRMGLLGAVLATTAANFVALVLILSFNRMLGFHVDRGLWVVLAAPLSLCAGPSVAALLLLLIVMQAAAGELLLSAEEKRRLVEGWRHYRQRFWNLRLRRSVAEG